MKIKTQLLAEALKELKPIISTTGQIPLLSCVKIVTGDKMEIIASDYDQMASRSIEFDGEVAQFLVNFNQLFHSLGDSEFTTFLFDEGAVTVKCGEKVTRIATMKPDDFPTLFDFSKIKEVGLNLEDLAKTIRAVHGFEHKDRYPINYLWIKGSPKSLQSMASDGANCAHNYIPSICAGFEILVPPAFAESFADALDKPDAKFKINDRLLSVSWDGGSFQSKLGEGQFPSSTVFTSQEMKFIGMLENKPIISELQSCLIFADQSKAPAILCEFAKKELRTGFTGQNSQLNNKFHADFEPYKCTLNVNSTIKCLSALGTSCKIYGNERMIKLEAGELTIYSSLML